MSVSNVKCDNCGTDIIEGTTCSQCTPSGGVALANAGPAADGETLEEVLARNNVKGPNQGAMLVNKETNEKYSLTQSVIKIGRDKSNNISLHNDSYISRHHAWVLFIKGTYYVEDLGSTNGTLLNGEVLSERKEIFPGDRIKFGRTELVFEII